MLGLVLLMVMSANSPVLGVIGKDHEQGCQVDQIAPETGAAKAGIAPGDVITDIDTERVASFTQLAEAVRRHQIGDRVTVGLNRDGAHLNLEVVLDKRPPRK
jgi:S1-C subfamily serine protease